MCRCCVGYDRSVWVLVGYQVHPRETDDYTHTHTGTTRVPAWPARGVTTLHCTGFSGSFGVCSVCVYSHHLIIIIWCVCAPFGIAFVRSLVHSIIGHRRRRSPSASCTTWSSAVGSACCSQAKPMVLSLVSFFPVLINPNRWLIG